MKPSVTFVLWVSKKDKIKLIQRNRKALRVGKLKKHGNKKHNIYNHSCLIS